MSIMKLLSFSNGVTIDSSQIVSVESHRQIIRFPGEIGEVEHLLRGRPCSRVGRLHDGSVVEINAGHSQLKILSDQTPA